jgi:hypothetical protein
VFHCSTRIVEPLEKDGAGDDVEPEDEEEEEEDEEEEEEEEEDEPCEYVTLSTGRFDGVESAGV